MRDARGAILALAMLLAACAPLRSTPATRYQGMLLNARDLGAEALRYETERDPGLRHYVARAGHPDFIIVADQTVVQLVYYRQSQLVHFHRDAPGGPSVPTELTPLPSPLLQILPRDLRAGTPLPLNRGEHTACWTVDTPPGPCRTCCATLTSCWAECRQEEGTTVTPRQKAT